MVLILVSAMSRVEDENHSTVKPDRIEDNLAQAVATLLSVS